MAVATIVILSVLLSIHLVPSKVSLKLGDVSPYDIRAHERVSYTDSAELERMRLQAAASARRVYDPDPGAADQVDSAVKAVFQVVKEIRSRMAQVPLNDRVKGVKDGLGPILGARISYDTFAGLLKMSDDSRREVRDHCLRIVSSAMSEQVYDDDMHAARVRVVDEARRLFPDSKTAKMVGEVASSALRPNQIFNKEKTFAAQLKAREEVRPELRVIEPGALIIAKGDTVFQKHIEKFKALGLRNPHVDYRSAVSLTLLVIITVLLVIGYLWRYHEAIYRNTTALLLLSIIVIFSVTALRVGGVMLGVKLSPVQVGHLGVMWVTAGAMLLAVLINPHVAIVISALLATVLSFMLGTDLRYASTALVTSLVGVFSVANLRNRTDMMGAVGAIAAAGVLMVWTTGGLSGESVPNMLRGSVWAMAAAMAATWLFWIGTAILERPFNRTTHVSLLELADTNKPLLRRLVMEAPGTYTHSVTVGHLAETAAESIGADSLVARVASYYHDIGKIRRPHFFVENQHLENIHDRMNPTLSALVITSHIKDGLEIAKEYRLPKVVMDIIKQHHGTSLVQYFYNQFTEEEEAGHALEQQFRYSGPKPRSKEAAIVMLADSIEAASRCIMKPTPAKIELIVNRIIAGKLRDGQLDQSDLTFREISRISESFVRTLTGTMHARIDYPEPSMANGKKAHAGSDTKQTKDAGESRAAKGAGRKAAAG